MLLLSSYLPETERLDGAGELLPVEAAALRQVAIGERVGLVVLQQHHGLEERHVQLLPSRREIGRQRHVGERVVPREAPRLVLLAVKGLEERAGLHKDRRQRHGLHDVLRPEAGRQHVEAQLQRTRLAPLRGRKLGHQQLGSVHVLLQTKHETI